MSDLSIIFKAKRFFCIANYVTYELCCDGKHSLCGTLFIRSALVFSSKIYKRRFLSNDSIIRLFRESLNARYIVKIRSYCFQIVKCILGNII